jgi:nitric oxide reductase NorD protein
VTYVASDGSAAALDFLASALSHRPLRVEPGAPGEPAWTDGRVIHLDVSKSARERLESLVVQASLLAAGSLEPDIVRQFVRRPALCRRYLAVEAYRALAAVGPRLPPSLLGLAYGDAVQPSGSAAESLATALGRVKIDDPPESFGTIRAQQLMAAARQLAQHGAHSARAASQAPLAELQHDAVTDNDETDPFANPSGGGGAIGKWLAKMLKPIRQLQGGGTPGGDTPTHWSRSSLRGSRGVAFSHAPTQAISEGAADVAGRGTVYPEWDMHAARYRNDWCVVREIAAQPNKRATAVTVPERVKLRRALARLGFGNDRFHRLPHGDDVDIDALIEARACALSGSAHDDAFFVQTLRRRRDLSVLILLDVSGSAAESANHGKSVHDLQRAAAAALVVALHELGDRIALYAYRSQGRSAVDMLPIKRFDEPPGAHMMQLLNGIVPAAYSRLGAAVRHGATVLQDHGGTRRQLLVVLSDGLAYDHGYEPAYGAADARRALAEARRDGVGCLCLSIGASTEAEALRRVFGSAAHATLPSPERLSDFIGQLFRAAIRSAEVRRRV